MFAMVDFNFAYFAHKPWRSLRLKKKRKGAMVKRNVRNVDFNLAYFAHKPWRSPRLKKMQRRYVKTQGSQWLILTSRTLRINLCVHCV
jgi:hypothetical protein